MYDTITFVSHAFDAKMIKKRSSKHVRSLFAVSTCKSPGLVGWHCPQVAQVTLVAHQHDDNVVVSVVSQLLQPALHVLVCQMFGDVVHQQSPNRTPVVAAWNIKDIDQPLHRLGISFWIKGFCGTVWISMNSFAWPVRLGFRISFP